MIIAGYKITSSESDISLFVNLSLDSSDISAISGLGKLTNEQGKPMLSANLIGEALIGWQDPEGF